MNEIHALILCNNPIALAGIREFLFYGKVAAIAVPKRNKEMQHLLAEMTKDTGVPVLTVDRKDYRQVLSDAMQQYQVTVGLIMTFPFLITPEMLAIPAKGFINFHYGLLPQCRGPQPIIWHMLNNDGEAGITLHVVDAGIDTGPVIMQEKVPISPTDTYGILQSKLSYTASKQAANLLKILSYGSIIPATAQDESQAAYYEMPTAKDLTINWEEMDSAKIERLVNTCNPWNKGAGTLMGNWLLGITEVDIMPDPAAEGTKPGTIIACNKTEGLLVSTCDLKILKINILYSQEGFFSGYRLAEFGIGAGHFFS
jgi:methionyl-tRNA formyltransferase